MKDQNKKFRYVWELCKAKTICEGSTGDADPNSKKPKSTHGGCGQKQPKFKKDKLKLVVDMKGIVKDDVSSL